MLEKIRHWDFPKIGKFVLLFMLAIENITYVYLIISNQSCPKAIALSSYLLTTSVITLIASALSISIRFYFHYWVFFFAVQGVAATCRLGAIIWIVILDNQTSDELFITLEGYAGLMRTSLIFLILQAVLIY